MRPVLVLLILGQFLSDSPILRNPSVGLRASGPDPFVEVATASYYFSAGNTTPSGTLPTCIGDATCVALCKVNSGGTAWECVDNTGASFGTVTQGTGTTYQDTFAPGLKAMSDLTDAKAPYLVSSTLNTLFKSDHTVVFGGYGTTLTDATYQHFIGFADGSNTFTVRNESGVLNCIWIGAGGVVAANNAPPAAVNGWGVGSCRRSGNDHYSRMNGTDSIVQVQSTITGNVATNTRYHMGSDYAGNGNLPTRGPLAFVAFYSEAKSTTQLRALENAFWGVSVDGGLGNGGPIGLPDDAGTTVHFFASGAHVVSPDRGLRTVGQSTDNIQGKWAADPFDVSSWTSVGTPLVGNSGLTTTSPFYLWRPASNTQCWNLEDDSNSAFEGKASAELQRSTSGGAAHGWNMRVWAAIGDAGTTRDKMRIAIVSSDGRTADALYGIDGGTEVDCDFTLDNIVRPYDCAGYTTDAGVTTVKGRVLVGTAAATTGSITVCNAQDTAHVYPQLSVTNNTAFGGGIDAIDPSAWPSTAGKGKYEVVFSPLNDIANPSWDGLNGTSSSFIYLFDAYDTTPAHDVVMVFGYQQAGRLLVSSRSSGGTTDLIVDGLSLTPWQRYALSVEWRPLGAGRCSVVARLDSCAGGVSACHAETVVASDSNGYCPDQPVTAKLGNRYDGTVPSSVFIDAVRVYQ